MTPFVYVLWVELDQGVKTYFYVGGAYRDKYRLWKHGGKDGSSHANRMIRIFRFANLEVHREIFTYGVNEEAIRELEPLVWDMLCKDFPVQPHRPNTFPKSAYVARGTPEARAKQSKRMLQPEFRGANSKRAKEHMLRPGRREKQREIAHCVFSSPEVQALATAGKRTPAARAANSKRAKIHMNRPEARAANSLRCKEQWKSAEARELSSINAKKRLNTPEAIAYRKTPEARAKVTERMLKAWVTRRKKNYVEHS
jgi:hypothetical protein